MKKCTGRMCKECPFKKGSAPGWLGPWQKPQDLVEFVLSENEFPCHMTMGDDDVDVMPEHETVCTGSVLFANKSFKLFRSGMLRDEQQRLKGSSEAENTMDRFEFIQHHERK